jgi:hypothetical protein
MNYYSNASQGVRLSGTLCNEFGNAFIGSRGQKKYKCPDCGKEVWVLNGAPYKGTCSDCLNRKPLLAPINPVVGIFKGLFG